MITNPSDYQRLLYRIGLKDQLYQAIPLPEWADKNHLDEKFFEEVYEIDLNTRKINAPKVITVESDHNAETIYFKFDRYYEAMDLTKTTCVIEYQNADKNSTGGYVYAVPYYDYITLWEENKIIIQWDLDETLTRTAGTVTFAFKFYIIDDEKLTYQYTLNTLPCQMKIEKGIGKLKLSDEYKINEIGDDGILDIITEPITAENYSTVLEALNQRINQANEAKQLYWTDCF